MNSWLHLPKQFSFPIECEWRQHLEHLNQKKIENGPLGFAFISLTDLSPVSHVIEITSI